MFDAVGSVLLIAGSMSLLGDRRGRGMAALLMALSPMVLFTVGVVNPSGMAIAGGIGMWAVLRTGTDVRDADPDDSSPHRAWSEAQRTWFFVGALAETIRGAWFYVCVGLAFGRSGRSSSATSRRVLCAAALNTLVGHGIGARRPALVVEENAVFGAFVT